MFRGLTPFGDEQRSGGRRECGILRAGKWHRPLYERACARGVCERGRPGRPVYFKNRDFYSAAFPPLFAGTVSVYAIYHPTDTRPVRFVDPNPVGRGGVLPDTRIARFNDGT